MAVGIFSVIRKVHLGRARVLTMEIDGTDLAAFALVERLDLLVSDALFVIHEHLDGTMGLDGPQSR